MDRYSQYLTGLQSNLSQIKTLVTPMAGQPPPSLPNTINGIPINSFTHQIQAYLANLYQRKTAPSENLYPINLLDPNYLDALSRYLSVDIGLLQSSKKPNPIIASNLPNLPPLLDALRKSQELLANENKLQTDSQKINQQDIPQQTAEWIERLRIFYEDSLSTLSPPEQVILMSEIKKFAEDDLGNPLGLQDKETIARQISNKVELRLRSLKQAHPSYPADSLIQEAKRIITEDLSPKIAKLSTDNINTTNSLNAVQTNKAWEDTKIGITGSVGHLLSPSELNYLTANIACEMTRPENAGLSPTQLSQKLEQTVRHQLQINPLLKIYTLPDANQNAIINQIVQTTQQSIASLNSKFVSPSTPLSPEEHNLLWSHIANQTSIDRDPQTGQLIRINPGNAQQVRENYPLSPLEGSPSAVDLLNSQGVPLGILTSLFSPDAAETALKNLLSGGPLKEAVKIIPGRLDGHLVRYLVMLNPDSLEFMKRDFLKQQMSLVGKTDLTAADFYSLKEAESALEFIRFLEDGRNTALGKTLGAYKFINNVLHPLQWLQNKIINKAIRGEGVGSVIGLMSAQLLPIVIKNPELAGPVLTYFFKSLTMLGIKSLLAKAHIYTLAGPKGMQRFEFTLTYKLKLKIRKFFYSKLTSKLTGAIGKKIIGVLLGLGTGPIGIALALFGDKIKKIVGAALGALGLWLYSLIGPFAVPAMLGLVFGGVGLLFFGFPGLLIGAGIGVVVGFITIWAMNGFSLNGITSFFGSGVPSAQAAGLSPFTAITTASIPASTALIPIVTLGGVATLSVYTIMVTSSAFFTPAGAPTELAGSKYIKVVKKANIACLPEGTKNIPNNIAQNNKMVIYGLEIYAQGATLKNVVIKDETSKRRLESSGSKKIITTQITTSDAIKNSDCDFSLGKNTPSAWTVDQITPDTPKAFLYGFVLNKDFTDSYISNTVTVEAEIEGQDKQTKRETLTFSIGNPPIFPTKDIAKNLIDRLAACYPYSKDSTKAVVDRTVFGDGSCINDSSKPPDGIIFQPETVEEIKTSVLDVPPYVLQCIGFVQAVLWEAGTPFSKRDDAQNFYGHDQDGFIWHNNLKDIEMGDVFIAQWLNNGSVVSGHAAIVYDRNNNGFRLAEALGNWIDTETGNLVWIGLAQYNGAWYNFQDLEEKAGVKINAGFLRYGQ